MDVLGNAIRIDAEHHTAAHARAVATERLGRLTPRERDVLRLLAQGNQLREIAQRLEISPRTIVVYKARLQGADDGEARLPHAGGCGAGGE